MFNAWYLLGNHTDHGIEHASVLASLPVQDGQVFVASNADTLTWRYRTFPTASIDFRRYLRTTNQAYAYTTFESSNAREVPFRFGSTGPAYVWINGALVYSYEQKRDFGHFKDTFFAKLKKGRNSVLVFVAAWSGDWRFSLSHPDTVAELVSGRVSGVDGMPVEGAEMLLFCNNQIAAETRSGYAGTYALALPRDAGACQVKATAADAGAWATIADAGQRKALRLNLRLQPAAQIMGKVYMKNGRTPNDGIFIEAIRDEDQRLVGSAYSNELGHFTIHNLPKGQYSLRMSTPWGFEYITEETPYLSDGRLVVKNKQSLLNLEIKFPETRKGTWSTFGTLDGLPYHLVRDVLVDASGQLACATYGGGVCLFEGHSFEVFSTRNGLGSNQTKQLLESADSSLWIATERGLARMKDGVMQAYPLTDERLEDDVMAVIEDRKGRLWVGTSYGLYQIVADNVTPLHALEPELPHIHVSAIMEDSAGRIWIGTVGGAGYLEGGKFTRLDAFTGSTILDIYADQHGDIWLATRTGIAKIGAQRTRWLTTQNGLAHNTVNDICQSPDGVMWFATAKGLSSYNGQQFTNYTTTHGLSHDVVTSIDCSQSKTIWAGTEHGISRLDYAIHAFTASNGLVRPDGGGVNVFDIVHRSDENMYVATAWGGIFAFDGNQFARVFETEEDLYVRNMLEINPNQYVFGSHEGIHIYSPDPALDNAVSFTNTEWNISMAKDDAGFLWTGQGFIGGGLNKYDLKTGQRVAHYNTEDGLPSEHVWSLLHDEAGGLWIGSQAGITLLDNGVFRNVHAELSFDTAAIYAIYKDRSGSIWFGGSDGIYRLEADTWTHFTTDGLYELRDKEWHLISDQLKLPENTIWSIFQSEKGLMWFGTQSRGLAGYDGKAFTNINARDGLAGGHVMKISEDAAGALWIATFDGGLTQYERTSRWHSINITDVSSGSKSYAINEPLPSFDVDRTISLTYSETDLTTKPENRQFLITITLADGAIIDQFVTKDRVFNWTPGEAGSYTLAVQYIDQNLNYSVPDRIALDIRLPLLKNPYFFLPGLVLLAGLIGYSYRLRRKYLYQKEAARAMEKKMLAAEMEAKDQLININQELLESNQKLEGLADSLREAVEKNKELLGITAHDLKNPLGGIIGLADMILEDVEDGLQTTYESVIEHVPLLKQEAERMLLITKNLLESQGHEEDVKLNKSLVFLGDVVAAVLRWNEVQARSKNITLQYKTCSSVIVEVDEIAVQRVLDNYVSNALKYSPSGSNVYIEVHSAFCDGVNPDSPTVKVSVRDEGPGLTEADMCKVFGKMQRLSAKPTAGEHSTGLGLFIVKSLIEAHEGEVGVDSEAGQGATFWFTLPCLSANAIEEQELLTTNSTVNRPFF